MAFILPFCNTAPYKRLQRILFRPCSLYRKHCKTAYRALQRLFMRFVPLNRRKYQTDTSGYNTTCTTLERITHARTACTRYQIPPPRRTLYRSTQPPYCYNVYKGATDLKPCKPGGVSILPTSGTGLVWHCAFFPARAARNHWRLSPYLFFGLSPDS